MTESRAVLLLAVLRERYGPDAELRRGDMTTKYRPQLVADGHVPTIAEMGYDTPTWGVHCYACSRTAEDYVWPCREGVDYDMPAELVAAAELDRLRAEGSPGVMHEVDRAFYDLAIKERDRWQERYAHMLDQRDTAFAAVTAARADAARLRTALAARTTELETARVYGGDVARLLTEARADADKLRGELDKLWSGREAVLDWARHNLGNSLIHKRIRECYGLPVDALTMMSPEVHALAFPTAAPKGTHETSTPAVAGTGQQDTATRHRKVRLLDRKAPTCEACGEFWPCPTATCDLPVGDGGCGLVIGHDGDHRPKPQPATVPPAADKADGSDELCSDKNGFHDGHDWTPDPCEPYRWCPGYPLPKRSADKADGSKA